MDLATFISKNSIDQSNDLVSKNTLTDAERIIGVSFGKELTDYLLTYGYLGYKYVELYGITSRQGMESDMVKQSVYMHQYFPKTVSLVAIENQGDGMYYLVDSNDSVLRYDSASNQLQKTEYTLREYILHRFITADEA